MALGSKWDSAVVKFGMKVTCHHEEVLVNAVVLLNGQQLVDSSSQ